MDYRLDQQLKDLLKTHDMTVAALSRKTGISSKTIYQWLNGQQPRDVMQIYRIAKVFNVSLDFIILGKDDNKILDASQVEPVVLKGKNNLGHEILLFPKKMIIEL